MTTFVYDSFPFSGSTGRRESHQPGNSEHFEQPAGGTAPFVVVDAQVAHPELLDQSVEHAPAWIWGVSRAGGARFVVQ